MEGKARSSYPNQWFQRWILWILGVGFLLTRLPASLSADSKEVWPGRTWTHASPEEVGLDPVQLRRARDYALSGGGSGMILRHGKVVLTWGDLHRLYDLKSTTKSIGVTALGLAIGDGKMHLKDKAIQYHPSLAVPPESNRKTGWIPLITIEHLATHTAGFEKPGGYTRLVFRPGTMWSYSDGGPNWLAECLTLVYHQDLKDLLFQRVFGPLGITERDLKWRENIYRPHRIQGIPRREFGSGISANVDAMARIGYLYLRGGRWKHRQILPPDFVKAVGRTVPSVVGLPERDPKRYDNASDHYGLLWWNNADGTLPHVPRDAFWSWGLYDSIILVIPSLDIVAVRAGRSWKRRPWGGHYDVLRPFFEPIALAVRDRKRSVPSSHKSNVTSHQSTSHPVSHSSETPPYPPSPVIRSIQWAPPETIIRRAQGSDNWPLTWGDDDRLYAAYGDGRGFRPYVEKKLSLGLAVIEGGPETFRGRNLRAPTLERVGDGPNGPKASGLLMVHGILYLLVRNVGNSQIVWSADHGKTWTWCRWKFTTSFGCPTFLNFGPNYAGARDDYVYIYSPDCDSAYERADRMVLARVPINQITNRAAYEFFVRLEDGHPIWTRDIHRRGAVFVHPGHCYRSGITYNAPLGRYLWCQTGLGQDPRFEGGLAIYDAPEPWGPWTTVFYTSRWDVGPGESSCFPTKWMSRDGKTLYLVFSGNDAFSVRKARLEIRTNRTPRLKRPIHKQ